MRHIHLLLFVCTALMSGISVDSMQLCGRELADMIDNICMTEGILKRSGIRYFYRNAYRPRASKRSVVDECCENACTITTLRSYCPQSDGITNLQNNVFSGQESVTSRPPDVELNNSNDRWSRLFDNSSNRLRHGMSQSRRHRGRFRSRQRNTPARGLRPQFFFVRNLTTRSIRPRY